MNRLEQDRAAALAASIASQAKAKRENALYDAAPDLLATLQGVLKIARGTSGRIIIEGWQENVIRAAIARATGETA